MHKKLLITTICILTTKMLIDASFGMGQFTYNKPLPTNSAKMVSRSTQTDYSSASASKDISMINDLATMQQAYAIQPDNMTKALYITSVLDNDADNVTIQQKIEQAQNLLKIIDGQISLLSGWLWNDPTNENQIAWLKEQRSKIKTSLYRLQEQSRTFGVNFALSTAKWTTLYLGIILAAYLAQDQYKAVNPNYKKLEYGDLAWVPIEQLFDLAKMAVVKTTDAVTGPTAQKAFGMSAAGAKAIVSGIGSAATTIASKTTDKMQSNTYETAKYIAEKSKPTPPSWKETFQSYWTGKPIKIVDNKINPQLISQPTPTNQSNYQQIITSQNNPTKAILEKKEQEISLEKQGKKTIKDAGFLDFLSYKWDESKSDIKQGIEKISEEISNNIPSYSSNKDIYEKKAIEQINKKYAAKEADFENTMKAKDEEFKKLGLPTMHEQEEQKMIQETARELAIMAMSGEKIEPILAEIARQPNGKAQLERVQKEFVTAQKQVMREQISAIKQQQKEILEERKLQEQTRAEFEKLKKLLQPK